MCYVTKCYEVSIVLINRGPPLLNTHTPNISPSVLGLYILPFHSISFSIHFIMVVFTFEDQTTSPVTPATLYKALVKDADDIVPKAVDSFKSVQIVEGNGGPGTIKKISFLEGTIFIFTLFLYFFCICINPIAYQIN